VIKATIRMLMPPQKRGEGLKIIKSVVELCRYDPGCLGCHIYSDLQKKNVLMLEQAWRSEEDLNHHIRSEEYLNLILALEMATEVPEIRFDVISHSTGIDTIEKVRNKVGVL